MKPAHNQRKREILRRILVVLLALLLALTSLVFAEDRVDVSSPILGLSEEPSADSPPLGQSESKPDTPDTPPQLIPPLPELPDTAVLGDSGMLAMPLGSPRNGPYTETYTTSKAFWEIHPSPGRNEVTVTAEEHLGQSPKTVILEKLNKPEAIWVVEATHVSFTAVGYKLDNPRDGRRRNTVSFYKVNNSYDDWIHLRNLDYNISGNTITADITSVLPEMIENPGIYAINSVLYRAPLIPSDGVSG